MTGLDKILKKKKKKKKKLGGFWNFDLKGEKLLSFGKTRFSNVTRLRIISVYKFHMKRLNLNTEKQLSAILKFSILRGKVSKLRKIQILEHKSARNYCRYKKISYEKTEFEC